jgi:SHS2 domain-containing protein
MSAKRPDYIVLDHTADLGVEIRGTSLINLFVNAGRTLMYLILGATKAGKTQNKKISISGDDLADLMVRYLSEILYLFEGEKLIFDTIDIISLSPKRLEGLLALYPFDPDTYEILTEIKAVTYHQIDVNDRNGLWTARIIFDL